jgi:CHASE3 domain sensor protein
MAIAAFSVLCSVLIIAFLVRQYLVERARVSHLYFITSQLLDSIDSSQNALLALKEAEAAKREYLLTSDPADRKRYLQSVQSWHDEIGVLELNSEHQAFAPQVQKFDKAGAEILNRLEAAMSSGKSGSNRIGSGNSGDAGMDSFDKLGGEARAAQSRELRRYGNRFETASGQFRRRFFIGAALLFVLVILEALSIRQMGLHAAPGREN